MFRYSRISHSVECYASLELADAALDTLRNVKPHLAPAPSLPKSGTGVDTEAAVAAVAATTQTVNVLLIFPDEATLLAFDLAVIFKTCL